MAAKVEHILFELEEPSPRGSQHEPEVSEVHAADRVNQSEHCLRSKNNLFSSKS